MSGHAAALTPATSAGLNVFHGVRVPACRSKRDTAHEVSLGLPMNSACPSFVPVSYTHLSMFRETPIKIQRVQKEKMPFTAMIPTNSKQYRASEWRLEGW